MNYLCMDGYGVIMLVHIIPTLLVDFNDSVTCEGQEDSEPLSPHFMLPPEIILCAG